MKIMASSMRALIVFVLATAMFTSCDEPQTQPSSETPKPQAQPNTVDTPVDDLYTKLLLSDLTLARTNPGYKELTGDLRPFWIVTGRIQNTTISPIWNIRLQVHMNYRGTDTEVDSAELILKEAIPPMATVSFMRQIQILPPQRPWGWTCEVVDAKTDAPSPPLQK